jgi:nucleoside phosphorylase
LAHGSAGAIRGALDPPPGIAVEMAFASVYKATPGQVPFLAIRGVSDVVGYERHPTRLDRLRVRDRGRVHARLPPRHPTEPIAAASPRR